MRFKPRDILRISWQDSIECPQGWCSDVDLDECQHGGHIESVGMFVKEDKTFIVITVAYSGDGLVNTPFAITKRCIKSIEVLDKKKRKL